MLRVKIAERDRRKRRVMFNDIPLLWERRLMNLTMQCGSRCCRTEVTQPSYR